MPNLMLNAIRWQTVDDRVLGGNSQSNVELIDSDTYRFYGSLTKPTIHSTLF